MFQAVFHGNPEAESYFSTAVAEGLDSYTLAIVSDDPSFLGLQWELLNDPDVGYLAGRFSSLVRRLSAPPLSDFYSSLTTEQLNVLLVSPAPIGRDEPSSSLAWETAEALESLDVHASLDCLVPPTFDAFSEQLSANKGHYHLVLFDGPLLHPLILFCSRAPMGSPNKSPPLT